MKLNPKANEYVHFEFSTDKKEVEVYIGSWFLCSVDIDDISEQAKEDIFINGLDNTD